MKNLSIFKLQIEKHFLSKNCLAKRFKSKILKDNKSREFVISGKGDALIKSGEIKVGMTFHDFSNLGILFNETRIVIPTQKEIEKKKFGRKHALVSKKSNSYYEK